MDNENNYNYDNQDPSSGDYGGHYHYDFDLNQQKNGAPSPEPNGFASAALVLGILSLALCCCCYLSIPLGALGILFAVLSKRDSQMAGRAKAGLGLSIAGLCLTLLMGLSMLLMFVNDADFRNTFDDYMEYYQGGDYDSDDLDDFLREYEEYFRDGERQRPEIPDDFLHDVI